MAMEGADIVASGAIIGIMAFEVICESRRNT
jgi:hypothetical protein